MIAFKAADPLGQKGLARVYDYILWYAKEKPLMKYRPLYRPRDIKDNPECKFVDDPDSADGYRIRAMKSSMPSQITKEYSGVETSLRRDIQRVVFFPSTQWEDIQAARGEELVHKSERHRALKRTEQTFHLRKGP